MNASITLTGDLSDLIQAMNAIASMANAPKVNWTENVQREFPEPPYGVAASDPNHGNTNEDMPADIVDINIATIRTEARIKTQEGKRDEVKALLTEFKSKSVSELDAALYIPFFNKLKNL